MISDDNDTQCSSRLVGVPLDLTFISECVCFALEAVLKHGRETL